MPDPIGSPFDTPMIPGSDAETAPAAALASGGSGVADPSSPAGGPGDPAPASPADGGARRAPRPGGGRPLSPHPDGAGAPGAGDDATPAPGPLDSDPAGGDTTPAAGPCSGRFVVHAEPLRVGPRMKGWATAGAGQRFVLRVDADGPRALQLVSGELWLRDGGGPMTPHNLLAPLRYRHRTVWDGDTWSIFGADGFDLLGTTTLELAAAPAPTPPDSTSPPPPPRLVIRLLGDGARTKHLELPRVSPTFRELVVELDREDHTAAIAFQPSHRVLASDDSPPTVRGRRMDLAVALGDDGLGAELVDHGVATQAADYGADDAWWFDTRWSDIELHDAMVEHWSHAHDQPGWWMWLLAAHEHEDGAGLGGLMFDGGVAEGPQRQGAALFLGAAMHVVSTDYGHPLDEQRAQRQRFYTMVHEIGHALNLAHSWEKAAETTIPDAGAWEDLGDRPDALSWMNYPANVPGFWGQFPFAFDDGERRFLRHAPEGFVRMGGAPFFVEHGLEGPQGPLRIAVEPREGGYEFLEPVRIVGTVENVSPDPALIPRALGIDEGTLRVVVATPRGDREVRPYTRAHRLSSRRVLGAGERARFSCFIGGSPGLGSHFTEPGDYRFQVSLWAEQRVLAVSEILTLHVRKPASRTLWELRDRITTDEVTRVFRFEGSRRLTRANRALSSLAKTLHKTPQSATFRHAQLALGNPWRKAHKRIEPGAPELRVSRIEAPQIKRAERSYKRFLGMGDTGRVREAARADDVYYVDVLERHAGLLARTKGPAVAEKLVRDLTADRAVFSVDLQPRLDGLMERVTVDDLRYHRIPE